ncbi:YrdB family protein [Levilactobacillus fujinensis]|uniref:YrdB family protein n=1 Tax=Levilactobacillus fujinensis TaxID=2486024 RepID=A0ABW1TG20_9LACO|nr:YrdB family protein [Levilactobacillus fujinensis]
MFKEINNVIRFLVEMTSLGLLVASGLKNGNLVLKIGIGIIMPVIIMLFWSHYMAPMSAARLTESARMIAEFLIFGSTAFLIALSFDWKVASTYIVIVAANTILDHVLT